MPEWLRMALLAFVIGVLISLLGVPPLLVIGVCLGMWLEHGLARWDADRLSRQKRGDSK